MQQGFHPQTKLDMRSFNRGVAVSGSRAAQPTRQNVQRFVTKCAATTSGVKLPATHLQASQAALQQLQSTKGVNREYINACKPSSF
jgi:hypothetical protein